MPPRDSRRTSLSPSPRPYSRPIIPADDRPAARVQSTQQATVGIVRNQIDSIYQQGADIDQRRQSSEQPTDTSVQSEKAEAFAQTSHESTDSPYDRTHQADRTNVQTSQWKQYHSAWQDYYQQYYERYYIGEVYRMRQTLSDHIQPKSSHEPHEPSEAKASDNDAAFHTLRADLLNSVRNSAVKVRGSQHFIPFVTGTLTLFLFWFFAGGGSTLVFANVQAYASPGSISPANIIIDPNVDIPISNEPRLIIPKINVDVPVDYNAKPDEGSQLKAMEGGVAWFGIPGADGRPGRVGNTVLSGHSSNDLFDPGDYKFIFARLDQLVHGDTFYVNYLGERYTYSITKKEVVKPTDVQKLIYPTEKPVITLITCVPLGTAQNRLLVTAEQISPNPNEAEPAPVTAETAEATAMPGNSPSLLGRLFGS